jgi:hypothetical protein
VEECGPPGVQSRDGSTAHRENGLPCSPDRSHDGGCLRRRGGKRWRHRGSRGDGNRGLRRLLPDGRARLLWRRHRVRRLRRRVERRSRCRQERLHGRRLRSDVVGSSVRHQPGLRRLHDDHERRLHHQLDLRLRERGGGGGLSGGRRDLGVWPPLAGRDGARSRPRWRAGTELCARAACGSGEPPARPPDSRRPSVVTGFRHRAPGLA